MKEKQIKILALESSCDETAAAVLCVTTHSSLPAPTLLSSVVSTQVDLHAKTGGVVPEVASRAHMEVIVPIIAGALIRSKQGDQTSEKLDYAQAIAILREEITHIACTNQPGLIGSLMVGFSAAKTLAYALDLPFIPVHHIEGHIYSALLSSSETANCKLQTANFPLLALTVSGGHTSLTLMYDHGRYETLGETIDDAAGEAFDKVAKMLEIGYPGGPAVSNLSNEFRTNYPLPATDHLLKFPRPILHDGTYNFSFSGLKTAVLQYVLKLKKERELTELDKGEICAAFEDAAVDVLVTKTMRAAQLYQPKSIILAGGVAANTALRNSLHLATDHLLPTTNFMVPPLEFCGDNAAMIALAAYYHLQKDNTASWSEPTVSSSGDL